MVDKEKLFKKYQRMFFLEYLIIALILFAVGFLRLFDVLAFSSTRLLVYNIITLVGVAYIIFDLFWNLRKDKRAYFSPVDKIPPLVLAMFLLVFDILTLSKIIIDTEVIKYCVVAVLFYAGAFACFMGFYHYKKPQKMVLDTIEEAYQAALDEEAEAEAKKEQEAAPEVQEEEPKE